MSHADLERGDEQVELGLPTQPAERLVEVDPDPETFEAVRDRHRQVHFTEWMEGVTYEEWSSER